MTFTSQTLLVVAALAVAAPGIGQASCGANFCALNLTRGAHTDTAEPGTRFDLRFEYIDQAQPRVGRDKVSAGALSRHHDEIRTINRNVVAGFDFTLGPDWALSLQLPFVARDHGHIHNHHGARIPQSWDVDGLGDARLLTRRSLSRRDNTSWNMLAGVKLPTGDYDQANSAGEVAERTLQPGSGTTDAVVGLHYETTASWRGTAARRFVGVQTQMPLRERDHYRPGAQYSIDLGVDYALSQDWKGLLQLNAQIKGRDRGAEAEPTDSGGSFVWLSPGLSYSVSSGHQLYGFVQLPLYQRVNGIQLTADYALIVGLSASF